jgi:hypothetical protein
MPEAAADMGHGAWGIPPHEAAPALERGGVGGRAVDVRGPTRRDAAENPRTPPKP